MNETLRIDGRPCTVVGVMPREFRFPPRSAVQLWTPEWDYGTLAEDRGMHWLVAVGRLKPGVTLTAAQDEMDVVARSLEQEYPEFQDQRGIAIQNLSESLVERTRPVLLALWGAEASPVALINQTLARTYWPGEDPVGQRIGPDPEAPPEDWLTIVGVVGDVKNVGLDRETLGDVYFPFTWSPRHEMTVVVRSGVEPTGLAAMVRREVQSIDPRQPVYRVATMKEVVAAIPSSARTVPTGRLRLCRAWNRVAAMSAGRAVLDAHRSPRSN